MYDILSLLSSSTNMFPTSISVGSISWRATKTGMDEGGFGNDDLYIIDLSEIDSGLSKSGKTPIL